MTLFERHDTFDLCNSSSYLVISPEEISRTEEFSSWSDFATIFIHAEEMYAHKLQLIIFKYLRERTPETWEPIQQQFSIRVMLVKLLESYINKNTR